MIVETPSSNYDDSYCIEYAKTNNGYIVTNDKFKDHIEAKQGAKEVKNWIQSHSIGFTFHGDVFLPNPDDYIFKKYNYNLYMQIAKG